MGKYLSLEMCFQKIVFILLDYKIYDVPINLQNWEIVLKTKFA